MKNLKTLLIPVGLIVLVVGIFAFTNPQQPKEDEKCTIKIVKIVNGVKTVTDSTFDCSDKMEWMSSFASEKGDSFSKMIKMMMAGDSNSFSFDINIEADDENVMKFEGKDGEDVEMHFDMKMLDGEDGVMNMMVNGKKLEIKIDDIQKHLKELKENINVIDDESGNVQIMIKAGDDDGGESHTVKVIKTIDDDGNVTVKKIVDGEEMELDDEGMFNMNENRSMTIDVNVEDGDSKKAKQIVIISKMTSSDKSGKKSTKIVGLNKKELTVEKLKFSPNPTDGKFDLSFNLDKKQPVQLKIVDIQGKEVYNEKLNDFNGRYSNKIDISKNGEGVYILQIIQNDKASTSKIMIK